MAEAELRAYEPSWRDKLAGLMSRYITGDNRVGYQRAQKLAGIADVLPGTGTALAVDDTARALGEGNYGEAAVNALGLIPEAGPALKAMAFMPMKKGAGFLRRGADEVAGEAPTVWHEISKT